MLGDIDTTGSLNAQIVHQLADRIRGKFVVQVGEYFPKLISTKLCSVAAIKLKY